MLKKRKGKIGRLFPFSDVRKDILELLLEGAKELRELKSKLKIGSPELLPYLRDLEKADLIYRNEEGNYALSAKGDVIARHLLTFAKNIEFFEREEKFWDEHDISGIPMEFRLRLHEIGDYKIYKSTTLDIFKPHEMYIQNLLKAKTIKGVSPVFHPEYPYVFSKLAEKKVEISLILTGDVFKKIEKEYKEELYSHLTLPQVSVYVCPEDIKVAFTTTDKFLSLRLFLNDGTYDFYQNIISYNKSALKFGNDLFRYYEKKSKKIEL